MEPILTKFAEQSPGLAVALFLVIVFMKYIEKKDDAINIVFNRVEALHTETLKQMKETSSIMGSVTEVIRKCEKEKLKDQ